MFIIHQGFPSLYCYSNKTALKLRLTVAKRAAGSLHCKTRDNISEYFNEVYTSHPTTLTDTSRHTALLCNNVIGKTQAEENTCFCFELIFMALFYVARVRAILNGHNYRYYLCNAHIYASNKTKKSAMGWNRAKIIMIQDNKHRHWIKEATEIWKPAPTL